MRLLSLLFVFLSAAWLSAQVRQIDSARSSMTIHVGRAGAFSFAGHEHEITAKNLSGKADVSQSSPSIEFVVEAGALTVSDPNASDDERAKVQKTMQAEVLEVARFPQIRFQSRTIRSTSQNVWDVAGELSLHGVSKPLRFEVQQHGDAYDGKVKLRQTAFGITPVRFGGGAVKVKDEVVISFHVVLTPAE
jgi:polyisoprenoid-binding protein YceI